ncbi:MAG TPA: hypothetical protein VGH25_09410, partial [Dongiaceae bacterium]
MSALDDLGFGDPNAPAAPPQALQGGSDISGGYHITKAPPALPDEPDASLLARTAIAEGGKSAEGQQAVIRAMLTRAQESGKPIAALLKEPGQLQTYWNGRLQGVDTTSPAFKSALAFAQTATPSPGIDSWYSPAGIKAQGFGKPPFDPASGTQIGGQLFGKGYAGGAAKASSALDDIGFSDTAPATGTAAAAPATKPDPALDAAAAATARYQMQQAAQSGQARWPIYDPANQVLRNEDGSIAAVRKTDGSFAWAQPVTDVSPTDPNASATVEAQPGVVSAWLRAHPQDPANQLTGAAGAGPKETSGFGQFGAGANQGLANVFHSVQGLDAAARSIPGLNLLIPGNTPQSLAAEKASQASGLMERNANDIQYGNSDLYGLGKMFGSTVATVPAIAATEGLGAAGLEAAGIGGAEATSPLLYRLPGLAASSVARGAGYGAGTSALTAAGSSAPLASQ